ncbi:MAG: molecular chaperone TorD family protein [Gammaproteobacteria bacterium]|nr:molecular chaperone TorD family protein [Gammaproteobacteria bacterium]
MTTSAEQVTTATGPRAVGAAREVATTAPARCRAYALLSALTASPHDVEVPGIDVGAIERLPFATDLDALCSEFAAAGSARLKAEYSALFEVGSAGPPAPIREDLFTGQKAGTREDIVRFYDFFGYRLVDRFAWAPDHLSVELEFMHYLCYHEARDSAERLSYQLGQLDFAERHPAKWTPGLAEAVARVAPGSFYGRVIGAVRDFVAADLAWQLGTVSAAPKG